MKITTNEFNKLDKNDKVYYYDPIVISDPITFSTTIKCVKLKSHAHKYDILHNVYKGSLFSSKEKALMSKFLVLQHNMTNINKIITNYWVYNDKKLLSAKSCFNRFNRIKKQKNIKTLVELYPEHFI